MADFKAYYWSMADLTDFAKLLGLSSHGNKPDLSARIERRLRGLPDEQSLQQSGSTGPRDSDNTLRPETPVAAMQSYFLRVRSRLRGTSKTTPIGSRTRT